MIYYIETNLISIIVGLILLFYEKHISSRNEASHQIMFLMVCALILLSIADIAAFMSVGKNAAAVQFFNIVYYIVVALGAYLWFLFVCIKTVSTDSIMKLVYSTSLPLAALAVIILTNPIHGWLFTVGDDCIYSRSDCLFITWMVEWGYFIAAEIINIRVVLKEKQSMRRRELKCYLLFALPLVTASLAQMLFYGLTVLQIGYMTGLLLINSSKQLYHMHRDEMTGIGNRNAFLSFRDSITASSKSVWLTIIMMDADHFKSINDSYGHLKGDQAIRDIADVLHYSIHLLRDSNIRLFRYAGDEFVITAVELDPDKRSRLIRLIESGITEKNNSNLAAGEKYTLSLSIGYAAASCHDEAGFDELLKMADEKMYAAKRNSHDRLNSLSS